MLLRTGQGFFALTAPFPEARQDPPPTSVLGLGWIELHFSVFFFIIII